ncbi:MAG: hypothetical protein JOY81_11070 [Alphaproteobacteria bacterium]|nr:hypothetical protein [Alphaproteobacteria bacterium]
MKLRWQLAAAFVLTLLFLVGVIQWLQNGNIFTSNGMYKSIQAEPWIHDYWHARLDPSNYLYFPLIGVSTHLLDLAGVLPGWPWKQFAYVNAFWAAICIVFVYAFFWTLTGGDLAVTVLATLFHLGTGFFLLLGVISEDIMPGYALVLASMALGALWFDKPTYKRVILVGTLFTIGWLIEWRLIFPTLPAFVLALAIADAPIRKRAAWIATLLVTVVAVAGIVQQIWEGHNGAVGLPDLLYTGKGVDSGWGGIGWGKVWLMLSGVGDYFLITDVYFDPASAQRGLAKLGPVVLVELAILVAGVVLLWPRRHDRRLRATAAVFIGTLGAGQVLNFYSQPQDPQMQINVMPWLTVTWALIVLTLLRRTGTVKRAHVLVPLAVLSLVPICWNTAALSHWRGDDATAINAVAELERRFPTDRTVYLYYGFEYISTWQFLLTSHTWDWDFVTPPGPAPQAEPRFKWISVNAGAVRHAGWTPEQHVAALKAQIDLAFRNGYRVVASDFWAWDEAELAHNLDVLSAGKRAPALYALLHDNYVGTPLPAVPGAGGYFEIRPKGAP